jgi:hypothetical protein
LAEGRRWLDDDGRCCNVVREEEKERETCVEKGRKSEKYKRKEE